jgi:hypothetical protein
VKEIKKTKRFNMTFFRKILLSFIIMLIFVCIGTFILYEYLDAFEESRIEHLLHYMEENVDYDFWMEQAAVALLPKTTQFENGGVIPQELYASRIKDVEYNYRLKTDETTDEAPVYIIRAGSRDIGLARFTPTVDIGFGFNIWEVNTKEFFESFVDGLCRNITITASVNAYVELNGVPITEEYRIECDYEYGATYQVNNIYGEAFVSVLEYNGEYTEPLFADGSEFLFPITRPFVREYTIKAENSITVLINDEPLSSVSIIDRQIPQALEGFVELDESPVLFYTYNVKLDELYLEPIVKAVNSQGVIMSPEIMDNGLMFYVEPFCEDLKILHKDNAERFIRSFISYTALGEGELFGMSRSSDLYRRTVFARSNDRSWQPTPVNITDMEITNFKAYGDEFFSCEISYEATNRTIYEVRELKIKYEVLYRFSGTSWQVISMRII